MAVIIGLQSTGEANTTAQRDTDGDELDDFISAPKLILRQFLINHFPTTFDECTEPELARLALWVLLLLPET